MTKHCWMLTGGANCIKRAKNYIYYSITYISTN